MFTDKIELKDFDKMDPEYKDLIGRVLTIQADCEIGGPHLYVQKMLKARSTYRRSYGGGRNRPFSQGSAGGRRYRRRCLLCAGRQPNEKRFVDTLAA